MKRPVRAICAVAALALLGAAPATDSAGRPEIEALLKRLADRDSSVRAAAGAELMGRPVSDLPLLRSIVIAHPPRPAQADALRQVVIHILTRESLRQMQPSGQPYIGVNHAPPQDTPAEDGKDEMVPTIGAEVLAVLPGAPAARVLQAGDVILGLDVPNRPPAWLTYGEQLREFVVMNPPGTPMTFIVRRAGQDLRLTITPELRPAANAAGFSDNPNEAARATVTLTQNAELEANRVFDLEWANLPGMSP